MLYTTGVSRRVVQSRQKNSNPGVRADRAGCEGVSLPSNQIWGIPPSSSGDHRQKELLEGPRGHRHK